MANRRAPGDSVLVDPDRRTGLDVLLPGPESEKLQAIVADGTFESVELFRAEDSGTAYALVAELGPDDETAMFVPAYHDRASSSGTVEAIRDAGEIRLFCGRLDDDTGEFVHEDPERFLPGTP